MTCAIYWITFLKIQNDYVTKKAFDIQGLIYLLFIYFFFFQIQGLIYVFLPCRDNDYNYIAAVVQGKDPKTKVAADKVRILHPDFVRYIHKMLVILLSYLMVPDPIGDFC